MNQQALSTGTRLLWFALYVRTRRERAVEQTLVEKGYETFLPTIAERRIYGTKKMNAEVPCFPSYLFCRFNPFDRLSVLTTPHVYGVISNGRSPESIPESELNAIKVMLNSRSSIERHCHPSVGERVVITRGPLAGIEGVLLRTGNSRRVALSVTLLRRSISAEVDPADVIPVNSISPGVCQSGAA